jgi:hypothetical protein
MLPIKQNTVLQWFPLLNGGEFGSLDFSFRDGPTIGYFRILPMGQVLIGLPFGSRVHACATTLTPMASRQMMLSVNSWKRGRLECRGMVSSSNRYFRMFVATMPFASFIYYRLALISLVLFVYLCSQIILINLFVIL